jgi:hypothetical protein
MRHRRRILPWTMLILLSAFTIVGAFWLGLVPQRLSPFSPLSLAEPNHWFIDPRLSALKRDRDLCRYVMRPPHVNATPVTDKPHDKAGCGWINAVSVSSAGGAEISMNPITCETAAAFSLWMEHEVQPAAQRIFGKRVTYVQNFGTYSCRNIIGSDIWKGALSQLSQHALANAIDISSFTLEGGQKIVVQKNWNGPEKEAEFLKTVHRRACRYFRVALSPNANKAHHDHFHFDRGYAWSCR